jgi:hypothetical protein
MHLVVFLCGRHVFFQSKITNIFWWQTTYRRYRMYSAVCMDKGTILGLIKEVYNRWSAVRVG